MNQNPYRYQIPGHHYVGDFPQRVSAGILDRGADFGVVGGRRCGKTSVIKVLENDVLHRAARRTILPVTIYVTALDQVSPAVLFRRILEAMTTGLPGYRWDAFAQEPEPYRAFKSKLEGSVGQHLTDRYGSDWLAVILVDEIDNLAIRLDEAGYGDTFFGNLRDLVTQNERLKGNFRLVVTGVNDPEGVINRGSPFNILEKHKLGVLTDDNVGTLVEVGFPDGMPRAARRRLVELTGRHPYLLQGVLQKLWRGDGARIDASDVERAAASFTALHGGDFRGWFNRFGDTARLVYGYLSAHSERNVSAGELAGALSSPAHRVATGEIEEALTVLATHGAIEADGEHYRVSGTMFRDWYHAHAPVATVEVVAILDQLQGTIDTLDISADHRRRAQDQLARARDVFSRDGGGDPGAIKKDGSAVLEKLWDVVKLADKTASFAEKLAKLAPFLDRAADWIPTLS